MQHLDCCLDIMRSASDCDELEGKDLVSSDQKQPR